MIESGKTLQRVSRARSSIARILALFLALSLIAHGLYFPQEWFIYGLALSTVLMISGFHQVFRIGHSKVTPFGETDALLLGMLALSLFGLIRPVKAEEGWLEALRWGIFWLTFRLGVRMSLDDAEKGRFYLRLEWLAVFVAIIGWLPWVSKVAGRLSSVFGYPNATAAFLGAILLLHPRRKLIWAFLGLSLLGTGSRAGVGLFLAVLLGQQLLLRVNQTPMRKMAKGWRRKGLVMALLGIAGGVLTMLYFRPAWDHLKIWGFMTGSWQERWAYYKDGVILAWRAKGWPQAGGWLDFPSIQSFPYWTSDPHSSFIHVLLNQGMIGIVGVMSWGGVMFVQGWKTWRTSSGQRFVVTGRDRNRIQSGGALLFLILHSVVDADFSFGALGLLFWILLGSVQKDQVHLRSFTWKRFVPTPELGQLLLSLLLVLGCGSVLINPAILEKEKAWNTQAEQAKEKDPEKSIVLWQKSLNWNQTQVSPRRELAELLLSQGAVEEGMKCVEAVLQWQPFDLDAYEWAQSVVWDAAEAQRQMHRETAIRLYRWVEAVPQRIEEKRANLTISEQKLWLNYQEFQPSPHVELLAEYARERQVTQL